MAKILLKNAALLDHRYAWEQKDILVGDNLIEAVESGISLDAAQTVYDLRGYTAHL